jgi:hypothetical protein
MLKFRVGFAFEILKISLESSPLEVEGLAITEKLHHAFDEILQIAADGDLHYAQYCTQGILVRLSMLDDECKLDGSDDAVLRAIDNLADLLGQYAAMMSEGAALVPLKAR